jgi:hypothetical protein
MVVIELFLGKESAGIMPAPKNFKIVDGFTENEQVVRE